MTGGGGAVRVEGMPPRAPLLEARELRKDFSLGRRRRGPESRGLRAVDGVSIQILRGETLGLVGESGSGKTTLARMLARLEEPDRGQIFLDGTDILALGKDEILQLRRRIQIVFQDPFSSLNPRLTLGQVLEEVLRVHGLGRNRSGRKARVKELIELVGLLPEHASRYPHELSGGQRQRIGIARALAVEPELIVLDEPVSALDLSIRAQVLNLLMDLQAELGLTYLFIAHDLSVVENVSDRVAVMYMGRIVEVAPSASLYSAPAHPYTQALLSAIPTIPGERGAGKERILLSGEIAGAERSRLSCRFYGRCWDPRRDAACLGSEPLLTSLRPGHSVACGKALEGVE